MMARACSERVHLAHLTFTLGATANECAENESSDGSAFDALSRRIKQMIKLSSAGRGHCLVRSGLAAAAILAFSGVPGQRAEAMSPINPGATPIAARDGLTTEVRFGGHHGGGGGG